MATVYDCWKCGQPLTGMILPVSRREECEACGAEIHVCRQCRHYDARIANQCREERAEDVSDKERANFCDYYDPRPDAFTPGDSAAEAEAKAQLEALFGGGGDPSPPAETNPLDDLFDPDKLNK